jgi:hypothetical protein
VALKRTAYSFETIETIPAQITILFIVRHPFDVLTSIHPESHRTGRRYHVTCGRWLGETMALKWLVESKRPKTHVLRFEDLIVDPLHTQRQIGEVTGLSIKTPANEFHTVCKPPLRATRAMHGIRPLETNTVERWKANPEAIAYLRSVQSRLCHSLPWVEENFGYDISLD